jgi:Protein of unknown function (DUF4231)
MGLTAQQLHPIYTLAKEDWLRAQSTSSAYERAFRRDGRISNGLKVATIVAALLTAVSTASPSLRWATVMAGVLTAALAAVDQQFSPSKSSQKYWDCCTQLESIKRDLSMVVIAIREAQDLSAATEALSAVTDRLKEATHIPTSINDADRQDAREAFRATTIAQMIDHADTELGFSIQESTASLEMAEDAPDIVPAFRVRTRPRSRATT